VLFLLVLDFLQSVSPPQVPLLLLGLIEIIRQLLVSLCIFLFFLASFENGVNLVLGPFEIGLLVIKDFLYHIKFGLVLIGLFAAVELFLIVIIAPGLRLRKSEVPHASEIETGVGEPDPGTLAPDVIPALSSGWESLAGLEGYLEHDLFLLLFGGQDEFSEGLDLFPPPLLVGLVLFLDDIVGY